MKKRTYDKAFYQKLWGLMIPIVLQNLMLALVAVADAFMLGGMDQNYMSAVSLATQIQFIQNMFLAAATASLGILGAQYWGKGDRTTLDEIFCMALRLCGLVSAVFFLACVFAGRYLMLIFTNESVLIEYGVSYLRIAGFSYLLTGISQCYLIIMKVSEHAKTTAAVSSATVCINIVLNAVFIYGAFGIPAMGVRGAAVATLIARITELTVSIRISYRKGYIHPQMKFLFYRNRQLSGDFYKCGMPILGAALFWGIGFTSYSSFMGHLGDQVLYKGPLSDTYDVGHERAGCDGQDGTVHDELPFSRIKLHRGDLDMAMEAGFLEETGYIGLDGGDEVALFMVQDIAIPVRIGAIEPLMIRMDIGIFFVGMIFQPFLAFFDCVDIMQPVAAIRYQYMFHFPFSLSSIRHITKILSVFSLPVHG